MQAPINRARRLRLTHDSDLIDIASELFRVASLTRTLVDTIVSPEWNFPPLFFFPVVVVRGLGLANMS